MKSFFVSVTLLLTILCSVAFGTAKVRQEIRDIRETVSAIPLPPPTDTVADLSAQKEAVAAVMDTWQATEGFASLLLDHEDMMEVRQHLAHLYGATLAGDAMTFYETKVLLLYAMDHLLELSKLSWGNIL